MSEKKDPSKERSALSTLKQHFEELRVQMALGKADASDYFEKQKEQFAGHLEAARERVEKSPLIDNDLTRSIKTNLDKLKVQLALGKMETKDAYCEQREKISQAIDSLRGATAPLRESAAGAFAEISDVVDHGADFFKGKLSALGINWGAEGADEDEDEKIRSAEEEAGLSSPVDRSARKAALEKELGELSVQADEAASLTGAELDAATARLKSAYEEVTRKLSGLLE
jgi:hypothetical protein